MPHEPQIVTRTYARVLTEVFPSSLTVRLDGYSVSAAGLCAHLAAVTERDQCSPETDELLRRLQKTYADGPWDQLDRDLSVICKDHPQARKHEAHEAARQLCCPGPRRTDPDTAKLERRRKLHEAVAAADAARRPSLQRCRCLRPCHCSING